MQLEKKLHTDNVYIYMKAKKKGQVVRVPHECIMYIYAQTHVGIEIMSYSFYQAKLLILKKQQFFI